MKKPFLLGLVEMTFRLVRTKYSLPEWQALKINLFAPCIVKNNQIFFVFKLSFRTRIFD